MKMYRTLPQPRCQLAFPCYATIVFTLAAFIQPHSVRAAAPSPGQVTARLARYDAAAVPSPEPAAPAGPVLRIETEMHRKPITGMSIDAQDRYLATSSTDKTVRIWDVASGRLVRTLRPPIGYGVEGEIDAVALSPDGRTVACGGSTGLAWNPTYSIYLFDRESGNLTKRIGTLHAPIRGLAYSPDGQFLLCLLPVRSGMRLYRTPEYNLVAQVTHIATYASRGDLSASFAAPPGRPLRLVVLAPTTYQDEVHLYEILPAGDPVLKEYEQPSVEHESTGAISLTPDGSSVAVAYNQRGDYKFITVDPLANGGRRNVFNLHGQGDIGDLSAIAFSPDGRWLYGGGSVYDQGLSIIRKWDTKDSNRFDTEKFKDIPAATGSIEHLLPLKNGSILFGASDPCFGIFDAQDRRIVFRGPEISDYHTDNKAGFLLSNDGSVVQFTYDREGKRPNRFDLKARTLAVPTGASVEQPLAPPLTVAEGLDITGWFNTGGPAINHEDLRLEEGDISRSAAIAPDQQHFLLGTDRGLRLYDRVGTLHWEVPTPGPAFEVNISGNGKVAAAALGDGTIRWYRLKDGVEICALFPHVDQKRWVLWSPSGYYDCSAGGEDLVGWHINHGPDAAADFFPASRFRSTYYRPDVLAAEVETQDETQALRLADGKSGRQPPTATVQTKLPPVVAILSPEDNAEITDPLVTVRYTLRTPSGEPATDVKALVDGRPVAVERDLQVVSANGEQREIKVSIPPHDCELSILVSNKFSASMAATTRIRWHGLAPAGEFVVKPKLYILAVGVSKYPHPDWVLQFPAKDATNFVDIMRKQQGGLYREVVVKLLTDSDATKENIEDGLDWLRRQTTSKDVGVVFLSGHGVNDTDGTYYYVPVNFDVEKIKRTGLPSADIKSTLAELPGKVLFFFDSCHSGNVLGGGEKGIDITGSVNELVSAENGAIVFAASTGKQVAYERPEWGNGAFTKAVVEALQGAADYNHTGRITVNMLDLYISERVKMLTDGKQTPTTAKPQTVPDFPVALKQ